MRLTKDEKLEARARNHGRHFERKRCLKSIDQWMKKLEGHAKKCEASRARGVANPYQFALTVLEKIRNEITVPALPQDVLAPASCIEEQTQSQMGPLPLVSVPAGTSAGLTRQGSSDQSLNQPQEPHD